MKQSIFALLIAATMGFGVALAQDSSGQMPAGAQTPSDQMPQKPDQKQFMKDCMTKARASNNGMSEQDMKKSCMEQLKASMGNPAEPVTPAH